MSVEAHTTAIMRWQWLSWIVQKIIWLACGCVH